MYFIGFSSPRIASIVLVVVYFAMVVVEGNIHDEVSTIRMTRGTHCLVIAGGGSTICLQHL